MVSLLYVCSCVQTWFYVLKMILGHKYYTDVALPCMYSRVDIINYGINGLNAADSSAQCVVALKRAVLFLVFFFFF